jgi:hypothetical protein
MLSLPAEEQAQSIPLSFEDQSTEVRPMGHWIDQYF